MKINQYYSNRFFSERLFWQFQTQRIITTFFTIFVSIVSAVFVVILFLKFIDIHKAANTIDTKQLIIIIGILYTFASLGIVLFGIINYFQSSESIKRLAELEIGMQDTTHDFVKLKMLSEILTNKDIVRMLPILNKSNDFFLRCFTVVNSKDLPTGNSEEEYELKSCICELLKIGNLSLLKIIYNSIDCHTLYRDHYRTCLSLLKKQIETYEMHIHDTSFF